MVRLPPALRPLFPYARPAYIRVVGALSPLSRALSRRKGGWLPTGFVHSLDDAATATGGRCVVARPAETITRAPARGLPVGLDLTDPTQGESFRRVLAADLPRGRVLGKHRAVIAGDGRLVDEVTHYFDLTHPRQHPLFLNPNPPDPLDVDGRLGVLAVRGDWMYYHFVLDALTRVGVLEQADGIAPPDRWYVPAGTPVQRDLLGLLGIGADRIVDADTHPHVRAETLVVPGWPADTAMSPPWIVPFLRDRLLGAAGISVTRPTRRIYITRGFSANNRSVRNDDDVRDVLLARGFETLDPGSLSAVEQLRTFAEAEIVVGAHGSALTNIVFASPGARLIELFPSGTRLTDYWRLSAGVPGVEYRYLSSPATTRLPQTRQTTIVRDIDVDTAALVRLVDDPSAP